jgi:glycogen debranching enzyme
VVLKEGRFFALSAPDGAMSRQSPNGHGLWDGDTRILSDYRLLIDGQEPAMKDIKVEAGWLELRGTARDLDVRRERFVNAGLHERVTITNTTRSTVDAHLELSFGADFAAMLAVRGIVTGLSPHPQAKFTVTPRGLLLQGANAESTEVVLRPTGTKHSLHLGPGEKFSVTLDALGETDHDPPDFDAGLSASRDTYKRWSADCAAFETDNSTLNELLHQSRDDMRMLTDRYPTGIYPTGGLPWFAVPFGRDALFTSMNALPVNPEIARGALRFLAANQGRHENRATEEEPGKILHEVRTGEVVERGLWPHILYGTVDATPLFLCVLAETLDWTGDDALFDELWPAAEAALGWCEAHGDIDRDGYLEYRAGVEARNEGWKDSHDSLTNVDGSDVRRPAALCEVQGYLYRGLLAMARRRPELKEKAIRLRRRFNRDFWMPREKFIAQALDADKQCVEAITSNPGHCMWAGILPAGRARAVGSRLVAEDLFSGWGIRTLSTRAINYDPCSYHNGSVWPHDCAIAAAGLRAAGMPKEAELVARAVLEAGMSYPDRRPPELWCGHDRVAGSRPVDYDASCSPQNWAAASTFQLVSTLLGLDADARRKRLRIAPMETSLWRRLEVTGLHFAGQRIDFSVDGTRVKVGRLPRGVKVETPTP